MPSLFRGRNGSSTKSYENIESANNEDRSGDAGYYTETYNGGIAPVTIAIDEHDHSAAAEAPMRRSWKQRKPMSYFADKEGSDTSSEKSSKSKKCVDKGEKVAAPNDLDVCCIQDGALGCLTFENLIECSKEGEENKKQYTQIRSSTKGKDVDDVDVLPDMCPVKSGDESTIGTGASNPLVERFRSMGAIRDKKEGGVQRYFYNFMPERKPSSEKGYTKQRLRLVLAAITLLLIVIVSAILGVTIERQKRNRRPNGKNQMIGTDVETEAKIKGILDQTPDSAWETDGSPQLTALEWLIYKDPLALNMDTDEEIQERFAAATLYYGTNGEGWKEPMGFLSESSICEWNMETNNDPIGIFCRDGRVVEINIVDHNLSGSLTNDLNYFSDIIVVNLYFNNLTGPIPDLSSLVKLEQLDLDDNKLSGIVPESLFLLPSLANIFLLFNHGLTGTIPEIEDTSKLVAISLLGCSLSGTIPKSLGQLSSLRLLQLKDNNFEGRIPQKLMSSTSLQTLGLAGNQLSGSIPPVMVSDNGSALTTLALGDNNLEGALPYGMDDLTNLKYLYAEHNQLTGSIRNAIMDLPNLEQLWLQGNNLSGDLSYFLSESKVLSELYLGDNDFSGDLNDFLAFAPPSLEQLDVSRNRGIEGYISDDIGNFASLRYFNVSGCKIGSQIPTAIGRLQNLETMDLSWNDFQGDVPTEMANMESLNYFDISRNRDLDGDLSSSFCEKRFDFEYALADCAGDIRVFCECCTHCCNREGSCGPNN